METIVKLPFEFLENTLKLKFSKLPEPLFTLRKRELYLLEAELNAPGRELAYIVQAQEIFNS